MSRLTMSHPFVSYENSSSCNGQPTRVKCDLMMTKVEAITAAVAPGEVATPEDNHNSASNEDVPYTASAVYEAFKPILRSLQVLGFYHCECYARRQGWQLWASRVYCWVVTSSFAVITVLTILNIVVTANTGVTSDLFSLLSSAALYTLIFFNGISFILASHSRKSLAKFFTCFARLDQYGGPFISISWLKKCLHIFCICTWVILVASVVLLAFLQSQSMYTIVVGSQEGQSVASKVLLSVYLTYPTSAWLLSAFLELSMGIILHRELTLFARSLKSKFVNGKVSAVVNNNEIEKDRKRYLEMTRIIKAADNSLSVHQAAAFGCNVASICLQVYIICYYPDARAKPGAAGTYTFSLLICVMDIAFVCTSGILVSMGLDKIRNRLQFINLEDATSSVTAQVTMFLNMVNNRVGLTVANLFIIDQNVILSLVGLIVTYFLIVVQFASAYTGGSSGTGTSCNCSSQRASL